MLRPVPFSEGSRQIGDFVPVAGFEGGQSQGQPFGAAQPFGQALGASPFQPLQQSVFVAKPAAQRPIASHQVSGFQMHAGQTAALYEEDANGMDEDERRPAAGYAAAAAASVFSPLGNPHAIAASEVPPVPPPQRHSLDAQVGACTEDIYSKMREVQHNHRPAYQPSSPYVKYRRFAANLFSC
jgi:hypothetical protein